MAPLSKARLGHLRVRMLYGAYMDDFVRDAVMFIPTCTHSLLSRDTNLAEVRQALSLARNGGVLDAHRFVRHGAVERARAISMPTGAANARRTMEHPYRQYASSQAAAEMRSVSEMESVLGREQTRHVESVVLRPISDAGLEKMAPVATVQVDVKKKKVATPRW